MKFHSIKVHFSNFLKTSVNNFKENRRFRYLSILYIVVLILFIFCLPKPLFEQDFSTVLEDADGQLLGAKISDDGQWRFPSVDHLPEKYVTALIAFEDKRFFYHPGIDPVGMIRAIFTNIKNKKVVSGGSTITMQVMRMSHNRRNKNYFIKLLEVIQSLRLELTYSKDEILELYASNAPFGGNVVGIDAASWRYFGKNTEQISWAEAAMLAILPNSPSLINPNKNRKTLFLKRNRLLKKLYNLNKIDKSTYQLAIQEPLPERVVPLPRLAPHLLNRCVAEKINSAHPRIFTTIKSDKQSLIASIIERNLPYFKSNDVNNIAILLISTKTGEVLAYHGNAPNTGFEHGEDVDIITAPRSTGSLLKPFLYAFAMDDGLILPHSLLIDIPTALNGYEPENYFKTFDGVIPVDKALTRSLNIPFVRLLQSYGIDRFKYRLNQLGLKQINRSADNYGLTLILGGAESCLWDMTKAYVELAQELMYYTDHDSKYTTSVPSISFLKNRKSSNIKTNSATKLLSVGAIWHAFNTMKNLERPSESGQWESFSASKPIAWKTGTSFGNRDAWSIGITPDYTIGVWVGNADGEGKPNIVGSSIAAPILFDILDRLDGKDWFSAPYDDMTKITVCSESGYRPLSFCNIDTIWAVKNALQVNSCPYHQVLHLNHEGTKQVNASCYSPSDMLQKSWFVLPPIEEFYYLPKHPDYQTPPAFAENCKAEVNSSTTKEMQFIYPRGQTKILIPKDLDGSYQKIVFKATHRNPDAKLFWHLDDKYIQTTTNFHQIAFVADLGWHRITIVDEGGNSISERFEIVGKN